MPSVTFASTSEPQLLEARTSAKTGEGVEEAFKALIIRIYEQDKQGAGADFKGASGGISLEGGNMVGGKKKGCC